MAVAPGPACGIRLPAVEHDDVELAEWCLTHGANPNSAPGPERRNRQRSLYDEAVFRGHLAVAELLVRYGARRSSTFT